MSAIDEFNKIVEVADQLLGENGCQWDHKQTCETLKGYMLEEMYEVIDAVDQKDDANLLEELGDLFYLIIFMAKVAEKEKRFTLSEVIAKIREKLIYRHPHVFGQSNAKTEEQIATQWELLKAKEKGERQSQMDGLSKALPSLVLAQKIAQKVQKSGPYNFASEEELGKILFEIASAARGQKMNAELALREELLRQERDFRKNEQNSP